MKFIYVVTHGDKYPGANPGMTEKGFKQIKDLRDLLPKTPSTVVSGTGKRHLHLAKALELAPNRYTAAVGGPDSVEMVDEQRMAILADGTLVNFEAYTTLPDSAESTVKVITQLPHNSVVCAGRPSMTMLGKKDTASAAVYLISVENDQIKEIKEVDASSEVVTGTVS